MANELVTLRQSLAQQVLSDLSAATILAVDIVKVENDSDARRADSSVKSLKACIKSIHDQRMSVTRKVDAFKKKLITEEEDICATANAELARVQSLCAAFLTAKAEAEVAAREAEAERIAAANEEAAENSLLTGEDAKIVQQTPESKHQIVSGVRAREYWTFDITDESAVPRQFCTADRRLIQQYMDECRRNGADIASLSISGVSFRKEIRV